MVHLCILYLCVFDLIVEVGSSLGLWIGISALGIFDILLDAGSVIIKKHVWKPSNIAVIGDVPISILVVIYCCIVLRKTLYILKWFMSLFYLLLNVLWNKCFKYGILISWAVLNKIATKLFSEYQRTVTNLQQRMSQDFNWRWQPPVKINGVDKIGTLNENSLNQN